MPPIENELLAGLILLALVSLGLCAELFRRLLRLTK